jgi:hypothetical protein
LTIMNYQQLKALARRADCAKGKERERLVETLLKALPTLDPFEGFSEEFIWFVKLLARFKWLEVEDLS